MSAGPTITGKTFPERAHVSLRDTQLRRNLAKATSTIRAKTSRVSAELPDWEALRDAGRAIKRETLAHLDEHLLALEASITRQGGHVHWARDAAQAREIIVSLAKAHGADQVIKIKSMTTDEVELNPALTAAGITPYETDLADMIVQHGQGEAVPPPSPGHPQGTAPKSATCSSRKCRARIQPTAPCPPIPTP